MEIMAMSAQEIVLRQDVFRTGWRSVQSWKTHQRTLQQFVWLGKKEIHVYHTESFGEYYGDGYLTVDGVFKYQDNWWGGRNYEFLCDAENIYRMLRSCYLRDNNLDELETERFDCEIKHIDGYFREFIEKLTKDKNN